MSHHQQIWEQTQPMEVKEAPGVPPPSPHFKKKAFWGLYHTKKWFLSDLRKRPRCPVWAGDTELNPSTLSLSNFISRAMAKLGPFSWQPALSRTGDGEIRDEEIGRAPQAQGSPPCSLSPRVGCAGQSTPSPDCPPAGGLQRGSGVSHGQGEGGALTHGETWTTRGSPGGGERCRFKPTSP